MLHIDRNDIALLSAAFQLRGYWLLEPQESTDRRAGIIRAFDNVLDLVSEIESGDNGTLPIRFSAWSVYVTCIAGAVYISKVVHSAYRPYIDVDRGKRAFNSCLLVLKRCSIEDNDLPGRSTRLMAQIWNIYQGQSIKLRKTPTLRIASRMLFSMVYDALWDWREKYGGLPSNGAPSLPPPFVTTSPWTGSASTASAQSPEASAPDSHTVHEPSKNTCDSLPRIRDPQAATGSPPALDSLVHDLPANAVEEPALTASEDFNKLWDIGFLNPNALSYNAALWDFNMPPTEASW